MKSQEHVYVALSGGVDSTVAAMKLLDQGYLVTGIHMQTWIDQGPNKAINDHKKTIFLAQQTANILGIPFISLDLKNKFYSDIVQPFIAQYSKGLTPNPCLFCNPKIKWGVLQAYAFTHGGDWFATGHYARIKTQPSGLVKLLRGLDKSKDQSYVLSLLSQSQLRRTLLPLGEMNKDQVQKEAALLDPDLGHREESQDLCFLGPLDYRDFLHKYAPETDKPGGIIDLNGAHLGEHKGLAFFTIGQRKGIRVAASEPYYVVEKDIEKNDLIVGFAEQAMKNCIKVDQVNWIAGTPPLVSDSYQVMVRYRTKPVSVRLSSITKDGFRIKLSEKLKDISPGQVAVLYQGDVCLGGGVIISSSIDETEFSMRSML